MSLINSGSTGLSYGTGLQFQTAIGGGGLDIEPAPEPPVGTHSLDFSENTNSMYVVILRFSITGLIAAGMFLGQHLGA